MSTDHDKAVDAAMKASRFDPLNHIARKSVEDAISAYVAARNSEPAQPSPPDVARIELVWIQNLKALVEHGMFRTDESWKRVFLERLDRVNEEELSKRRPGAIYPQPAPIETAEPGIVIIAHEPMYGWLIVCKQEDGTFLQKSSGNFWMDVPASVEFTHWLPYPHFAADIGEAHETGNDL